MTHEYIKTLFQAHYRQVPATELEPSQLPNREFAFMFWGKKGMVRHKGFMSVEDYKQFLVSTAPMNVYHSATLYHSPWRDKMEEKGYDGCDLIFDIDCDHVPTPCKADHDTWTCKSCGKQGKGRHPATCPGCSETRFDEKSWLCDACLEVSKTETVKLVDDFLVGDFGLDPRALEIYFSGHRGYHVHVDSTVLRGLSSDERREMTDYITATSISLPVLGFHVSSNKTIGFNVTDPGWKGKIASKLLSITSAMVDDNDRGFDKDLARLLRENREELVSKLHTGTDNWSLKGIGAGNWTRILTHVINELRCEIDVPVSIDLHRLIRAPGSLHGKTGFKTCKISREDLDAFDPFSDPVVFTGDEERVRMLSDVPRFRIGDVAQGPFAKDEVALLSHGAAVFLACKGKGVLA